MKKLFLLLTGGMFALAANAQFARHTTEAGINPNSIPFVNTSVQNVRLSDRVAAKTTNMDSVDVSISKSAVVYNAGSSIGFYAFGSMPSKMIDSIYPETFVANYGFTAEPAVSVKARIFQGTTSVYSTSITVNAPMYAYDTLADFRRATPAYFYSNTVAQYTVAFSINPAADAVTANDMDTAVYKVTDSTLSENAPNKKITGSTYVHRPGSSLLSNSPATMFSIPAGQTDTLTSVSVAFGNNTKPGQVVGVQIFHFDGETWVYDGLTQFRALAVGEISTASLITHAVFMVDEAGTGGKIIMFGGAGGTQYAAVVKGSSNADTVTVLESENPAMSRIMNNNSSGLDDTSNNDGGNFWQFGQGHLPFASETTPLIDLNFGIVVAPVDHTGINNLAGNDNYIGTPFPNPANTNVTIPMMTGQDATVTITLYDVVGRVARSQSIQAIGGRSLKATLATSDLSDGIYIYSVELNGLHNNGHMVIAH